MAHVVEISLASADVARAMSDMRAWLDSCRLEPNGFRQMSDGGATRFRLEFAAAGEVAAFARTFAGLAATGAGV